MICIIFADNRIAAADRDAEVEGAVLPRTRGGRRHLRQLEVRGEHVGQDLEGRDAKDAAGVAAATRIGADAPKVASELGFGAGPTKEVHAQLQPRRKARLAELAGAVVVVLDDHVIGDKEAVGWGELEIEPAMSSGGRRGESEDDQGKGEGAHAEASARTSTATQSELGCAGRR